MTKLNSLHDLFVEELRDLYSAENQLIKAIPKMSRAASCEKLQAAFQKHLKETQIHVHRLEAIFEVLGESPKGKTCKAMKGLIEEGEEVISEEMEAHVKNAALISAAQRVEHYEMAGYGTVRTYAQLLDQDKIARILQQTLDEEGQTDKHLTELAKKINVEAESAV